MTAKLIPGDSYRAKGLREQLAVTLEKKGITDRKVLDAIKSIPRHLFIDTAFIEHAYEDKAFAIGKGQTISQPYTVAMQSQLLEVKRGEKILEIGTGSGYQACVLAELGAKVFTIERHRSLHQTAKKIFQQLGYRTIKAFFGDGYEGIPTFAPFDKAIITAAAPYIPEKIIEQLKTGGFLIVPLGEGDLQKMLKVIKQADGSYEIEEFGDYKFVPMLPGKEF